MISWIFFLRILEHCDPEAADDAIAGDDMMNDDDYLCRDLLVLENVEAIAVEDHISVSPWPIDGFLGEKKNM